MLTAASHPRRDIEVIEAELIFKDLETVEKKTSELMRAGENRREEIQGGT